jgi:hypothetical protein
MKSWFVLVVLMSYLLFTPNGVFAQESLPVIQLTGEVRGRSEIDMRDFNSRSAANTFTLLRTRVGLDARPSEDVRVFIQGQDSRVFGQERDASGTFNTLADTRNFDLHQGYIEVKKLFVEELTLRIGRQELIYGNERIIGAVGWSNVGRSFDGAMLRVDCPSVSFELLAMTIGEVQTYTSNATPSSVAYTFDGGYDVYGTYATVKGVQNHKIDGYVLYQINRDTAGSGKTNLSRYTVGSYTKGNNGAIDYDLEVAYQGGKRQGIDVSAYIAAGSVGYSFKGLALSRIGAGYEILSGTPVGDAKYKSFDPTFHTGHKFYGFMDYFINIPGNTRNRGLTDLLARSTISVSEKVAANVWFHQFSYAQSVGGEKTLGQELDIVAQYRHNKKFTFDVGTSVFLPDHLMRQEFHGGDAALWGYVQATVSF